MIICTDNELAIGEYRRGSVTNVNCEWCEDAVFIVLAEATEAEYRKAAEEAGATHNPPFSRPMKFYRVATD